MGIFDKSKFSTQSKINEFNGYKNILIGMWSALRNPKAHENIIITKQEAFESIVLCGMMMDKLENWIKENESTKF